MSEPISIAAISSDFGRTSSAWMVAGLRQASPAARPSVEIGATIAATIAQKIEQKGRIARTGAGRAKGLRRRSAQSIALAAAQTPPNRAMAEAEDRARTC